MRRLPVHQRPANRHRLGKFMGTGSQGQVGKLASRWRLLREEERSEGKRNLSSALLRANLLQGIAEDGVGCPAACLFPSAVACLNEKWEDANQVLVTGDYVTWSIKLSGAPRAMGPNHEV